MKTNKGILGAGILTAIASSLCCITPVLALMAGTSGMAVSFSWVEPLRPYLLVFTVLVLGFAWYQKLKPKKPDCDCETLENSSFFQTKTFLLLVTVFAIVMSLFPYYSSVFYPSSDKQLVIVDKRNIQKITVEVSGMTCEACEQTIIYSVNKLNGIVSSEASFDNENAVVEFDQTKTTIQEIENAINETGYKVVSTKKNSNEN